MKRFGNRLRASRRYSSLLTACSKAAPSINRFPRLKPGFLPLRPLADLILPLRSLARGSIRIAHSSTAKAVVFCLRPHKFALLKDHGHRQNPTRKRRSNFPEAVIQHSIKRTVSRSVFLSNPMSLYSISQSMDDVIFCKR